MNERDGESFLGRWSRRKLQAGSVEDNPAAASPGLPEKLPASVAGEAGRATEAETAGTETAETKAEGEAAQVKSSEDDFADVDFATLDADSDYTRFMGANVPDAIRQRALARLWTSTPMFASADPIHDYHGDYTDAAVAVRDGIKTAYRVGRGFLSDEEVAAWDRLGKPETEPTHDVAGAQSEAASAAAAAPAETACDMPAPNKPSAPVASRTTAVEGTTPVQAPAVAAGPVPTDPTSRDTGDGKPGRKGGTGSVA